MKVLREMLRVGRRGSWRFRISDTGPCGSPTSVTGRAPKTNLFPHEWYDSPNIHFLTVHDFEALAHTEGWTIERRIFLHGRRKVKMLPNLLAEVAVFLIRK